MGVVFGLTAIAVIVQAGVLSLLLPVIGTAVGSMGWFTGLATGALLGLAFAAAPAITHKLFGGFRLWVWVLEAGQDIVSLAAMGAIIGAFKSLSDRRCRQTIVADKPQQCFGHLWQRNYHEHIVSGPNELKRIQTYIRNNPGNWLDDPDYVPG